ncbi:hypothetical protein Q762_07415 [Flavobacterium cauense R2A-7]|nr:hypothetical protein Q762_07415 [Flavobacterium cauense R2A-7]
MQWVGEFQNVKILNTFYRKHNLLNIGKQIVFNVISVSGKPCILRFFHCDKCKKYYSVFKRNFVKKYQFL